ncbi:MAG TPA: carboxymuconolactone decarboxylase family protein [Dermatophilaceae bacterium]|jgi:AhpD family alkylhydroperoxidase|nr:carboxymuconolactone decarboxylase family protein [Actinomycetales bacterium]HMT32818.1 carboxymuconolactone decarboxylase family protein [Dermatophilaceae bacterium]HMT88750.1 carboxymuconolactone decarboxylase family protein [Dermatophilaceae bacterium]
MSDSPYPRVTPQLHGRRVALAPHIHAAFEAFSAAVFADGALDERTKQLIAVAVAHTTQCPYCITGHTTLAHRAGATDEQVMEAIWVAAEMRAGGAYAHSVLAITALDRAAPTAAREDRPRADTPADDAPADGTPGGGDARRDTSDGAGFNEQRAISREIWEGGPVYPPRTGG